MLKKNFIKFQKDCSYDMVNNHYICIYNIQSKGIEDWEAVGKRELVEEQGKTIEVIWL